MSEDKELQELLEAYGGMIKNIVEVNKLALPADGKIHVTVTKQTQSLPSPLSPYNYRGVQHIVDSVPAMADLMTRLGTPENSIVYFNDAEISTILDITIKDRPFDTAIYQFEESPQANDWTKCFGVNQNQKQFIKFIKSREQGEIANVATDTLIATAQRIQGKFKIVTESEYIDSNNMGFIFKVEDSGGKVVDEGRMELPSKLSVSMPLLKESPEVFTVDIELELTKPIDGNPPFFVLTCPHWDIFWRRAVETAVKELKDKLLGYLIIAGEGFSTN